MIGFTGPYSDVNFGDYAMLVNNVRTLSPDALTLFVYDEAFMERIRDDYFADVPTRLVRVELADGPPVGGAPHERLTPIELLAEVRNLDEVRAAIAEVDVLYVNGGGYLNSLWTRPHRLGRLIEILIPALVAETMGKPVRFTANGYGPFRGDEEFFAAIFGFLRGATFAMRDGILSPYWLERVGVGPDRRALVPDDLLFPEPAPASARNGDREDAADAPEGRYVVMESYYPVDFFRENLEPIRQWVTAMRERHGVRVVFLPLHLGHGGVDQGRFLAENVPGLTFIDITEDGYLPLELATSLVGRAELVVSNRYHALVLALGLSVPAVSVLKPVLDDHQYYFGKNVGVLQSVLGSVPYDTRDHFFTDYLEALAAIADDFDGIVSRQREALAAGHSANDASLCAARAAMFGM